MLRHLMDIKYIIKKGYFSFKKGYNLSQLTKDIPEGYGAYVFHKNTIDGEILYIGKSGTVNQNGSKHRQNLKKRLTMNQCRSIKRQKFFNQKFDEDSTLQSIVIEWMIVDDKKCLPSFLEASLIQKYYELNHKLPLWNKEF